MNFEYDLRKLEDALYDFYCVTGVSVTFFDVNLNAVTGKATKSAKYCTMIASHPDGSRACRMSNTSLLRRCKEKREPVRHICAAGLVDIAIPLLYADSVIGYLMLGQIRNSSDFPNLQIAHELDLDKLRAFYAEIPCRDDESITAILHVAVMLTKYILLKNMIRPRHNSAAEVVTSYIDAHITERLTVEKIAKKVFLSPSGIYKAIHSCYGCTVSEYVNTRRLEKSLDMLNDGEESVEAISSAIGFSSAAYFSRCFKNKYGVSPLQYRKRSNTAISD